MKRIGLFWILSTLILLGCIIYVQGQYSIPTTIRQYSAPETVGQYSAPVTVGTPTYDYSQYYTMGSGAVPSYHFSTPERVDAISSVPSTVYLSNQMQPVSYATYQSSR